jgi:hypothetical protein
MWIQKILFIYLFFSVSGTNKENQTNLPEEWACIQELAVMMIIPHYVRNLHKTPTENHPPPPDGNKKTYEKKESKLHLPLVNKSQTPNRHQLPTYSQTVQSQSILKEANG